MVSPSFSFIWVIMYTSKNYAGGNIAAGRATHARPVLNEVSDKKGHPGLPCCDSGVE